MRRASQRDHGQGATEYLVIAALVGIIVLGVLVSFGEDVRHLFDSSAASVATPELTKKAAGKSADVPKVNSKSGGSNAN